MRNGNTAAQAIEGMSHAAPTLSHMTEHLPESGIACFSREPSDSTEHIGRPAAHLPLLNAVILQSPPSL